MVVTTHHERQTMKDPYMVVDITTMQPTHRYIWTTGIEATRRNKRLEDEGSPLRYKLEPKVISHVVEKPEKEVYCLW